MTATPAGGRGELCAETWSCVPVNVVFHIPQMNPNFAPKVPGVGISACWQLCAVSQDPGELLIYPWLWVN